MDKIYSTPSCTLTSSLFAHPGFQTRLGHSLHSDPVSDCYGIVRLYPDFRTKVFKTDLINRLDDNKTAPEVFSDAVLY